MMTLRHGEKLVSLILDCFVFESNRCFNRVPLMPSVAAVSYSGIDVPFLLHIATLEFDKVIIYFVAVLMAITINAEAQAFMATALGDAKRDATDRFHFNPLFHIHPAGLIAFAIAGFGWSKQIRIDAHRLKHPALYLFIIRFGGALANLLLAGIAGSILWVLSHFNLEDQVFTIVVSVNLMAFAGHLIPLPPFAGATLFYGVIPETIRQSAATRYTMIAFPYILLTGLIFLRWNDWSLFERYLYPIVQTLFKFILWNQHEITFLF